ncbi:hypothetical protein ABIB34_000441 [Rhodococcus sp. UYP5]
MTTAGTGGTTLPDLFVDAFDTVIPAAASQHYQHARTETGESPHRFQLGLARSQMLRDGVGCSEIPGIPLKRPERICNSARNAG